MSNWITGVYQFQDGVDTLSAGSINPVVASLAQRDQYLFEQLNNAAAESMLISTNQAFYGNLIDGTPVYFNTSSSNNLYPALATFTQSNNDGQLFPAQSSFVFGIVKQIYAGSGSGGIYNGDVYVRGLITDTNINYQNLLDGASTTNLSGGSLQPGPLFLSSLEPGCLSTQAGGVAIFVGYYLGGSNFVLAPNIDSLNQLYFNYQLYLSNYTTGNTTLAGSTWTINDGGSSVNNLGWMSASNANSALGLTVPSGAVYYYNVPTNANIASLLASSSITALQAQNAYLMKTALPAQPASYSLLFVNGILQVQYDTDHTNGAYIINNAGVWWCNNQDGQTPWQSSTSSAITLASGWSGSPTTVTSVTVASITGLQVGQLMVGAGVPSNVYITSITGSSNPYTLYLTSFTSTANSSGTYTFEGGTPILELFITKINPNYASSVVTSITSETPVITITNAGGNPATNGDLELNFNLPVTLSTALPGSGNAIQSITSTSSGLLATTASVINSVVAGPGLTTSQTAGQVTITISNYALNGEVTDLEPVEADFVYKGLNGYLRLKRPQANQLIGFIGRLMLPSTIPPSQNLLLSLLAFTETGSTNSNNVSFQFQYACTNQGSAISTAVTNNAGPIYIPGTSFPTLVQAAVTLDQNSNNCFVIPYTAFSANSYINFNISRTYDTSATYVNPIGILGVLWAIE